MHRTRRSFALAALTLIGLAGASLSIQSHAAAQAPAVHAEAVSISDDGMWITVKRHPAVVENGEAWIRPAFGQPIVLDREVLRATLADAPMEFTEQAFVRPVIIELPTPDGDFAMFEIFESPVMAPELAAQLPDVKTYCGQGVTDPTATLRMDWTPAGFHAQVLSVEGSWYIDPFTRGDTQSYTSYYRKDAMPPNEGWSCQLFPDVAPGQQPRLQRRGGGDLPTIANRSGTFLQTYRTAVGATVEYTNFHGGTAAAGQAAIVTAINRVTGVYERETAIRLQLVANNINIVFTNGTGDSYSNTNGGAMLSQNQTVCDSFIGSANYDIGHVFSTGGGGVAFLGVVCINGSKAGGVTGQGAPTGDPFYIDYVAHEMGHQFGANHNFNATAGACGGGNRNGSTAYEPGSGSTIMGYAGICDTSNLQNNSDDYFNFISFDEILAFSTGSGGCPTNVANGNTVPSINAGPNFTIPIGTPFILTPLSYSDPNGDTLTFCWEQRNLGASQNASGGAIIDNGSSPYIRTFPPSTNPTRTVPRISNLISNTFVIGERLPATNRNTNFRCTVRDNRAGGGGVNTSDMIVTSTTSSGPFVVTFPNAFTTLSASTTVTWNVANTTSSPVSCANVRIDLSTDGGNTFPTTLLASTPNDGSQLVTLPSISTSQARIRVMGVGNIFFDISNVNFTITPAPVPGAFSLTTPPQTTGSVSLEPTFVWTTSNNATSYTLTVDTDTAFTPPFAYQTTVATLSHALPAATLNYGTLYFWRVEATNGAGSAFGSPNPNDFVTLAAPPFCQGDANGNGVVDFDDITTVLANWLASYTPGSGGLGDANNDGSVDFNDLTTVLSNWGNTCP